MSPVELRISPSKMASKEWHLLGSSAPDEDCAIFAKWTFDENGYNILATDLTQVWSESLDQTAVISRAHSLDCSIDPAEDARQIQYFWQKIEAALLRKPDTKMTLTLGGKEELNSITITTSSDLAGALRPLRWSMTLQKLPAATIRSGIVMPLIYGSFFRQQQVQQLETILKEKDSAIQKLADKVEGMGIDLSSLFPQVGPGRGHKPHVSREQLFKHIRGLGFFDKEAWESGWRDDLPPTPSFQEVVQSSLNHSNSASIPALLGELEWVRTHPIGTEIVGSGEETNQSSQTLQEGPSQEFQQRSSPPAGRERLNRPNSKHIQGEDEKPEPLVSVGQPPAEDDDTTEDEDDEEAPVSQSGTREDLKILQPTPAESTAREQAPSDMHSQPRGGRRLGLIGGTKNLAGKQNSTNAEQNDATGEDHEGPATKTTTAATADNVDIPEKTSPSKKLGVIGGRRRLTSPEPKGPNATEPKLKEEQSQIRVEGGDTEASKPTTLKEKEEEIQNKADRKREELKRDLEARSTISSKKRRRF